jgi:NitT/TauT family transport system permease protein
MKYIAIHSLYSLWRIAAGLFLAVLIGLPLGVIMGYFPKWDRFLSPLLYLTYPIPKIALMPILMLLFGIGEFAKILMIFLIIVFQVIVAIRDNIRSIPKETYYPLYSLGAPFGAVFFEVLWPASMPKFITAIRVAMATAISVLFFTETFGTQYGMGYFIMDAWLRVNYLEMYSGIIVLSLMGLFLFAFIDWIEKRLCHWQYK